MARLIGALLVALAAIAHAGRMRRVYRTAPARVGLPSVAFDERYQTSARSHPSKHHETINRLRARNVVCDHSFQLVPTAQPGQYTLGPPWGVCSGD